MTRKLQVLVVEDDPLITMLLEDYLELLGHELAGAAETLGDALIKAANGGFDLVLLDVNLAGEPSWPVADLLAERGLPFILASGESHEAPPAKHAQAALLVKPFTIDGLEAALKTVLSAE